MTRRVLLWSAGIAASIVAALVGAQPRAPWRAARPQWAIAIVLAPVGAAAYLLWPNAQWWNYGALLAAPFFLLATERAERLWREKGDSEPSYGARLDGPWGPP